MPITFDRSICRDLNETISREWLVTNGLGGYAAGTVAGVLTRMQHGLLVTTPPGAVTPQLLLAKIDEEVVFDERTYYLGTNEYRDGTLNPTGFVHLETFRLEDGIPIFTYHLGGLNGIMLEKRIWMPYGLHTTCIQYRVLRTASTDGSGYRRNTGALSSYDRCLGYTEAAPYALSLTLLPFSAHRPYDQTVQGSRNRHFQIQPCRLEETITKNAYNPTRTLPQGVVGCTILAQGDAVSSHPCHILIAAHPDSHPTFIPTGVWYWNFLHRHDAATTPPAIDDLYLPGVFRATLWPAEDATLTIFVSTEPLSSLPLCRDELKLSYLQSIERQQQLFSDALPPTTTSDPQAGGEEYLHLLLQAGDRFLIHSKPPHPGTIANNEAFTDQTEPIPILLSDYYHMESRTRDTLITLPGLMLTTGRYDDALKILRTLARHFRGGLLPDRLALTGHPLEESNYGNVDATLWFFYALDHYLSITHNYALLEELYHRLANCLDCYVQGTSNGIRIDPDDGLLLAQQSSKSLTWMNASVDGSPVTPRPGKPVEVNALWYYALSLMHEWSQYLSHAAQREHPASYYERLRSRCQQSFLRRFWHANGGHLYDIVDGPTGNDASIRPNQLFALSLRHAVLDVAHRQSVFEVVTRYLLTPYGLRTLAPHEPGYRGKLGSRPDEQQQALHQGSVWTWLMRPYIEAMLNIHRLPSTDQRNNQDERLCQEYLWRKGLCLLEHLKGPLSKGLLGMSASVFDGDSPHHTHRSSEHITSALSTAELLHTYHILAHIRISHPEHSLS
jgi:predicted glycogen debranching enzyme